MVNNDIFSLLSVSNFTGCGVVFSKKDKSDDIILSCGLCNSLKQKKALTFINFEIIMAEISFVWISA